MTLIEIMVVLVILGMIAGAVGINVFRNQTDAYKRTAALDAQQIVNAVQLYRLKHGTLPESLEQIVPNEVARVRPDPWGNAYVYSHSGDSFQITSYGPDKQQGGGDDILVDPEAKS